MGNGRHSGLPEDGLDIDDKSLPELGNIGSKSDEDLIKLATEKGVEKLPSRRTELVMELLGMAAEETGQLVGAGVLDILHDGYGFLRTPGRQSTADDVYVSHSQIRRFGLRPGDMVAGQVRPPRDGEKYYGLLRVEVVNGLDPERGMERPKFEKLTSVYPDKQFITETDSKLLSTRIIDIVSVSYTHLRAHET